MQLRLRVRIARGSTAISAIPATAILITIAFAGSVFAADPPGQFVPDAPPPDGLRDIRVLESGQKTEIWQPKHAGEKVEPAKAGPGRLLKRGPIKPPAKDSRAK